MEQIEQKIFGKRMKVGECFRVTSKKMIKGTGRRFNPTFKLYRRGDKHFFQKGKRRYFCEVMRLVETTTGITVTNYDAQFTHDFTTIWAGPRYWQCTYLVKILEN